MMAAGKPIAREFRTGWSPEEVIRHVVLWSGEFRLYRIESYAPESAVLFRRFTPTVAWAAPLALAAAAFVLGVAGPGATVESAEAAGTFALLGLVVAGVLALLVKADERVTFSARADGAETRVLVAGSALPGLVAYVAAWEEAMQDPAGSW